MPDTHLIAWRTLFVAALLVSTYLALIPVVSPAIASWNDKIVHASGFVVLAFLADFSFPRIRYGAAKFLSLLAYGVALEIGQHFLPPRSFSVADMVADAAGLAAYGFALPLLRYVPILSSRWR
jgi:VanZ family protein